MLLALHVVLGGTGDLPISARARCQNEAFARTQLLSFATRQLAPGLLRMLTRPFGRVSGIGRRPLRDSVMPLVCKRQKPITRAGIISGRRGCLPGLILFRPHIVADRSHMGHRWHGLDLSLLTAGRGAGDLVVTISCGCFRAFHASCDPGKRVHRFQAFGLDVQFAAIHRLKWAS